jgi:hypothetical protein
VNASGMKTATVIAWLGIVIYFLGIEQAIHWATYVSPPGVTVEPTYFHLFLVPFGAALAVAGGIAAKPRYIWPVFVVIGIMHCVATLFFGWFSVFDLASIIITIVFNSPGVAFIITGLLIFWYRRKENLRNNSSPKSGI